MQTCHSSTTTITSNKTLQSPLFCKCMFQSNYDMMSFLIGSSVWKTVLYHLKNQCWPGAPCYTSLKEPCAILAKYVPISANILRLFCKMNPSPTYLIPVAELIKKIEDLETKVTWRRSSEEALQTENTQLCGSEKSIQAKNTKLCSTNEALSTKNVQLRGSNEALQVSANN